MHNATVTIAIKSMYIKFKISYPLLKMENPDPNTDAKLNYRIYKKNFLFVRSVNLFVSGCIDFEPWIQVQMART